jgi:DeoR/GlpR family transcriptional regulator of sugar metabolism
VRTHGGAILNQRLQLEPEYQQRALRNVEEKRQIGALAASLIQDGDISSTGGTTTTQLILNIRKGADITVITNNLSAALELSEEGIEIILLGGTYQPRSQSVAGRFAMENLGHIYADQAFIGVDGITLKHGYTVPSIAEAEVIRLMMSRTNGPINALADFSKWGVVSNFEVAQIHQVDRLITDEQLGKIAREALASKPVEVFIAQAVLAEPPFLPGRSQETSRDPIP